SSSSIQVTRERREPGEPTTRYINLSSFRDGWRRSTAAEPPHQPQGKEHQKDGEGKGGEGRLEQRPAAGGGGELRRQRRRTAVEHGGDGRVRQVVEDHAGKRGGGEEPAPAAEAGGRQQQDRQDEGCGEQRRVGDVEALLDAAVERRALGRQRGEEDAC